MEQSLHLVQQSEETVRRVTSPDRLFLLTYVQDIHT